MKLILNILTLTTSALVNADDILVKFGGVQNGKVLEWKIDRKHLESAERSKMTANQLLLIPLDDLHQIAMTAVIDKNVRRLTASPEPFWPIEEDLKISENWVINTVELKHILLNEEQSSNATEEPQYSSIFLITFSFKNKADKTLGASVYILEDGLLVRKSLREPTKSELDYLKKIDDRQK